NTGRSSRGSQPRLIHVDIENNNVSAADWPTTFLERKLTRSWPELEGANTLLFVEVSSTVSLISGDLLFEWFRTFHPPFCKANRQERFVWRYCCQTRTPIDSFLKHSRLSLSERRLERH